jgi:predicted nucleotidyltransferase
MDRHLIDKIREVGEPIRAKGATGVYVYGSRARADDRPESDLDVFVDYDPDSDFSIVELAGIKRLLESALSIDVHITTRDGLSPMFREEVEKQAIRVL